MNQPTARQFSTAVRKALKAHGFPAIVKGKTTSFGGFGYGDGIFAKIDASRAIPDDLWDKLVNVKDDFEALGDTGNHFIISLGGSAYPFGGSIKERIHAQTK